METTLTPQHERWNEFIKELSEYFEVSEEDPIVGTLVCCDRDELGMAAEVLAYMGGVDIERTLQPYKERGIKSSCQILFDSKPPEVAVEQEVDKILVRYRCESCGWTSDSAEPHACAELEKRKSEHPIRERLKRAFEFELWDFGIFARQNWACCQSCGIDEVPKCHQLREAYLFYHMQDNESFDGEGRLVSPLFLTYGNLSMLNTVEKILRYQGIRVIMPPDESLRLEIPVQP